MTLLKDTDLLPYWTRMSRGLGRLMPMGVTGPASPVSITTSIALADTPCTWGLRYCGHKAYGLRTTGMFRNVREFISILSGSLK